MDKLLTNILTFVLMLLLSSCGIYSFTGASVSPEVKTFSVQTFEDNLLENPNLRQLLTEALVDRISSSINLSPVALDGDIKFTGEVTRYSVRPVANTSASMASESELVIDIKVTFTNEIEPDKSFESQFSDFARFDMSINFIEAEAGLVEEINERLIDKIFNKALVNW